MRIAVDFPAPFSPTMAWIVPGSTRMSMWSLASTSPKRLVIALNSSMCFRRSVLPPLSPPLPPQGRGRGEELRGQHVEGHLTPQPPRGRHRPPPQLTHRPADQREEHQVEGE